MLVPVYPAGVRRAAAALIALAAAAPAAAQQRLVTIETPSRFVDVRTAVLNGERPTALKANVLLPDGYGAAPKRRWPVLYLLHGVGDTYATMAKPASGDVLEIARGFPGIIVMPEGGRGFYTDWYNGGRRGDPGWESYDREELIPLIEKRFRIARGRRNHAIAGISMGGMGAAYLGAQRPDYFGSVITLSGFVSHQRETVRQGFSAVAGVDYEQIFGPLEGPYASGHNPTRLAANLRQTDLLVFTGNGVPQPGVAGTPAAIAGGAVVEAEIFQENEEFVQALRDAGVVVDYRPGLGVHDWPYWRQYLRAAFARGVFGRDVAVAPSSWTFSTVTQGGRMWTLRYRFAAPPATLARFARAGRVLRGTGAGTVRLADIARRCSRTLELPFERRLPLCRR